MKIRLLSQLIKALPFWIGLAVTPALAQTTITVNAGTSLATIPPEIYGNNAQVYSGSNNGTDTTYNTAMSISGCRNIRWPGGSYADQTDWSNVACYGTWAATTPQFITCLQSFGGTMQPIVNFGGYWCSGGTGTQTYTQFTHAQAVSLAEAWVTWNMSNTGSARAKNWEVGNESFGTGNWEKGPTVNGTQYGQQFVDFYNGMKAIDSSIKIGAVACPMAADYNNWTPNMLTAVKAAGVTPDFLIIHNYPVTSGAPAGAGTDAYILSFPSTVATQTTSLNNLVSTYLGSSSVGQVKYFMTEYNSSLGPDAQTDEYVNAMFVSEWLLECAKSGWMGANLWATKNGGSPDYGFLNGSNAPYPCYYVFPMLTGKFGNQMVSCSSSAATVKSYAALNSSGNLTIFLVNDHPSASQTATINISGFTPATTGQAWVMLPVGTGSSGVSQEATTLSINGTNNPAPSAIGGIAGTSQATSTSFTVTLQPSEMYLLVIPKSSSSNPTNTFTQTPTFTRTFIPTPTATFSFTRTNSPTATRTNTPTLTPTNTRTVTPANSPTSTATQTRTNTAANTPTSSPTNSFTPTRTHTPTNTATNSATPTTTLTRTNTPTNTFTNTATFTATLTRTSTPTNTLANTPTLTPTNTPTMTRTSTRTVTPTDSMTPTASLTATPTATSTPTNSATPSNSNTPTNTSTNSTTSTRTNTPTNTLTPANTATSSATNTTTSSPTASRTNTAANTSTLTVTSTLTITPSSTATSTATATPTNSTTATPTSSPTQTRTNTPTLTRTDSTTATPTSSPTSTATASLSPTRTHTATLTSTNSPTSTATKTDTSTATATPTLTATPTITSTPTLTPTGTMPPTNTSTLTATNTRTMTPTATLTASPSSTPTGTATSTVTSTASRTNTSTTTSTTTNSLTPTATLTPTSTLTTSPSSTPSGTATSTATQTATDSATVTVSMSPTSSATATPPASASSTPTASFTASSSMTATPSPTATWTLTKTATLAATSSLTSSPTSTATVTATPAVPSMTFTATSTPQPALTVVIGPNPATGPSVNILVPLTGVANVRVEIFTVTFRKVLDKTFLNAQPGVPLQLELTDNWGKPLADGIYYVMVTAQGKRSVTKLLILR